MLGTGGSCVLLGVPKLGTEASFVVGNLYNDKSILGCRYGQASRTTTCRSSRAYLDGRFMLDEMVSQTYDLGDIERPWPTSRRRMLQPWRPDPDLTATESGIHGVRHLHPGIRPELPARGRSGCRAHGPHERHRVRHRRRQGGVRNAWATEHHFLDEYSHMSANDVALAYMARATERIHLGQGIQPLPQVNHSAKVAEKVAMLDHLSAAASSSARGAGSHADPCAPCREMTDLSKTREIWEDVIAEFPKMWLQDEYEGYEGKYWSLPSPRSCRSQRCKPHPAIGTPRANEQLRDGGARGLGVLGFSVGSIQELEPVMKAYKKAIRSPSPWARSSTTTSW